MNPANARTAPRILTINVGNTSLLVGVFVGRRFMKSFRAPLAKATTLAGFRWLVESRVHGRMAGAVIASVVPAKTDWIAGQIHRTWGIQPKFLTAAADHGLVVDYRDPRRFGADRLAAALGARELLPDRNAIIVDCGTAISVTALRRDGRILGGAILPGLRLWPAVLAARTAQLPEVDISRPRQVVGRSPQEGLNSGIYYGCVGAIREVSQRVGKEAFGNEQSILIGTGGDAPLFHREELFNLLERNLILQGLRAFWSDQE